VITDVVDANLGDVTPQDGGSYNAGTRAVTWNIGAVAVNAGGTVHFTAVIRPLCNDTTIYNSATIDSDQTAPEDTPTKKVWVTTAAGIELTSGVSPDPTTVGQVTNFSATVSGSAPSYLWSWTVNGTEVATTQNASYTFTSAGVYNVSVSVTDCGGNANSWSCHNVTVNPPA
jgi:PKD repeat protein